MTHTPVLVREVVQLLAPQSGDVIIDATVGNGGHAAALLDAAPNTRLLGIDRDPDALPRARETLKRFGERVMLVHAPFTELASVAAEQGITQANVVFFDLGLSSPQLDSSGRGFSFKEDEPLDMRMDPCHQTTTAADLVNTLSFEKLRSLLRTYGEEPHASTIAHSIVSLRSKTKISTTQHLLLTIPAGARTSARRHHPATLTFQALRLAVNHELEQLTTVLPTALAVLAPGGRLAAISFHSLEDRIVKNLFRTESRGCLCPPEFPVCRCGHQATVGLLTKKAITASPEELLQNPRARSAKLRTIIKRKTP